MDYHKQLRAGLIDKEAEQQIREQLQHIQCVLKPLPGDAQSVAKVVRLGQLAAGARSEAVIVAGNFIVNGLV